MERKNIQIIARRWFKRTSGNTYHSCTVLVNGKEVGAVTYQYGYGEQYLRTALDILQDAGIYTKTGEILPSGADKDYIEFLKDLHGAKHDFFISVTNVQRKKDL